jgi:hypothetical protein
LIQHDHYLKLESAITGSKANGESFEKEEVESE